MGIVYSIVLEVMEMYWLEETSELTTLENACVNGEQYQSSPFSLRFVKESNAHLSMMQGTNTCMIEMDMVTGNYDALSK